MSPYQQLLKVSQDQTEAFQRGDVRTMQLLLIERAKLVQQLPPAGDAERNVLQQVLEFDRTLSTALRERMMALRSEAANVHQTRVQLNGYRTNAAASLLNFVA